MSLCRVHKKRLRMVLAMGDFRLKYLCFFFKQKTAYEMRISDWSSDVCSSDLYRAWNRWFPTDRDFVPPGELSARARDALRRTIGLLEKAGGAPFINKWQRNATRAQALQDRKSTRLNSSH